MKYLKYLYIKNFQSHKDTVVEFSPGLNILVGESDQGKTAVIRALRWLYYNKSPKGDFIRIGEDYCSVTAELSDGTRVSRIKKGKKINRYEIKYPDGTNYVEDKVGNQVPERVQEILGNGRLYIDSDKYIDISIASQLEPPFLLTESDGDKAKIIGLIADLDIIDAAGRRLLLDINQANGRKKDLEEEIKNLNRELEAYDDLDYKKSILEKGQRLLNTIAQKEQLLTRLQEMKDRWIRLNQELAWINNKIEEMATIEQVEKYYRAIAEKKASINSLQELQERWAKINFAWKDCAEKLKKLEVLEELARQRERIEEVFKVLNNISNMENRKGELLVRLIQVDNTLEQMKNLEEAENIIASLWEKRNLGFELQKVKKEINDKEKRLEEIKEILEQTGALERGEKINQALALNLQKYYQLLDIKEACAQKEIEHAQILKRLKKLEENYTSLLNEYIAVLQEAGRCPTCNTRIDEFAIEQIKQSLNLV
ncbi:exonuclease SbcC [Thermosyntropha lipolytica DSM 11003]|uniref:Nuclease SbcCD subunit C n=1 Tax=Thermosyntropha lipolytica DSM 11003 TaxID=1123382 RepID=A0A1M5PDX3_9FIRM|nr:AAA family ATPase [Thermosyntropha lipolytica]SHG99984.1 exonuclease SbcC [Thermosyntropha lipolytica DSM 11003]